MEWLNILKTGFGNRPYGAKEDFEGDWKSIIAEMEESNPEAAKALQEALGRKNTGSGREKRTPEDWEIEEARSLSLPIDAYIDITEEASKLAEESTPKSRADIGYIYIMQDKKTKRVEMFFDEDMGNDMGYQTLDYYDLENVISYWEDASFEWYFTQQLEKHKSTGEKEKE